MSLPLDKMDLCGVDLEPGQVAPPPVETPTQEINPLCADPAYRAAHPDECEEFPKLVIKPESVSVCQLRSTQFQAFVYANGVETEVTLGAYFESSDPSIAIIGAKGGKATGIGEGICSIRATWQTLTANSQITVMGDECCDDVVVGIAILVDNSRSMSTGFDPLYSPTPGGGGSYGTKLTYAKALAREFAIHVNFLKDKVAIFEFSDGSKLDCAWTQVKETAKQAVNSIPQTLNTTDIEDAIRDAAAYFDEDATITRRVILLITDGEDKVGHDPLTAAEDFKSSGGVMVVAGVRAWGDGYDLLQQMASGGFFINGYKDTQNDAFTWLRGTKGYYCAANCAPPGGVTVPQAKLNYTGFVNWDVVPHVTSGAIGTVDLIGGDPPHEQFDLLPGNGMYVDLAGSSPGPLNGAIAGVYNASIKTKATFAVTLGETYELSLFLAGNQRANVAGYEVNILVVDEDSATELVNETETLDDWVQDFTQYIYSFTPAADGHVSIRISLITYPTAYPADQSFGILLDVVKLRNSGTDVTLFYDDFDDENPVALPVSGCTGIFGYSYDQYSYCDCLTVPIPAQSADPYEPKIDMEV